MPTVDQLRRGADVRLTKKNTIRVSPLKVAPKTSAKQPTEKPTKRAADQSKKPAADDQSIDPTNIVYEFEFNTAGRLIERRILDVKADKLLARTRIAQEGTVLYETFIGNPQTHEVKLVRSVKSKAPRLVPKTKGLVVLPMPFRTSSVARR